ncbi:MAG: hypothetical protein EBS22_07800, partial [Acidimicrobiia bacterium]|nr:hypothetical protein [Acidimicrobiia bacterium]
MGAPAQRETQHRALRVLSIALFSILLGSILGIVFGDPSSADVNEAASRSAQNMLSVGNTHACVVMSSGGVKCWGRNHKYQTGDGFPLTQRTAPVDVEDSTEATGFLTGVSSVSLGYDFSCVVTTAESAKCWGANASGQATGSNVQSVSNPTDVVSLGSGVAAFSAGMNHSCALLSSGGVQCWGSNSYGQLGDGTLTSRKTPGDVSGLTSGVVAVSAGFEHSCAALATGSVKCWGYDSNGQVGSGSPGSSARVTSPVTVANVSGAVGVTTGKLHSCALTATGVVKCWGRDDLLGTGNTAGVASGAVDVSGL